MKRWLLLLPVLPIGLVLWLFISAPARQSVKLPDGSVLTLREVSYGRQHRHVFGNVAQRLYALIPEKLRGGSGNIGVLTDTNAFLCFWLARDNVASQPSSFWFMLEDTNGYVAGSAWHNWKNAMPVPHESIGVGFRDWPRRDSHVRLVVYQMAAGQTLTRLATFTALNPTPHHHPTWKAAELPISARVEDNDVTLERLMLGANFEGHYEPLSTTWGSRALAEFRVSRNGRRSLSWAPASITISDATGNTIHVGSWGVRSSEGQYRMNFRSALWPGEPWKLRVEFSRAANYSSNQLVHFPPIALPKELVEAKTTNTFAVNVSTNWNDVSLTVTALERRSRSFSAPAVRVRCGTLPGDHRLTVVRIEDDQKRNVAGGGSGSDNAEYKYSLSLASNSAVLHLTLAIHKSVFAEFVAMPTLVTTNTARAR